MREYSTFLDRFKFAVVLLILLIACCTGPRTETERYHRIADDSQLENGAVKELQREAMLALEQGGIQLAIDYLQRAIKIEPRNPFNWHYLAQTYWHNKDYASCIDMLERSISYSSANEDLDRANLVLRDKCEDG